MIVEGGGRWLCICVWELQKPESEKLKSRNRVKNAPLCRPRNIAMCSQPTDPTFSAA